MTPTQTLNTTQAFFFEHAGYSHDPKTETPAQGRTRCALNLAAAEAMGREAGLSFEWVIDQCTDSSVFSDARNPWQLWACIAYDSKGSVVASLGGVDFGRYGKPWGDDYRRTVEAELAEQHMLDVLATA
jgi:hypothetical protein